MATRRRASHSRHHSWVDMSKKKKGNPSAAPSAQTSRELLIQIITFLKRSGLSKADLLSECRAAIEHASETKSQLKVVHVGLTQDSADIVNRWLRDPIYLNAAGKPDDLLLKGSRSFTSLVKSHRPSATPSKVLGYLIEYGNVKKVAAGRFRLVHRYLNHSHPKHITFEPNLRFLSDAIQVSTKPLSRSEKSPRLYWHCANSSRVDPRHAQEFLRFSRQRSLSFMHEINDWLDEHEVEISVTEKNPKKLKRLGVGLFGICADSD